MNQDVCIKVYASLGLVYIYSFLVQSVLFFQMQYFLLFVNKRWHIPCLKIVVFIFFLILGIVFNVCIEYMTLKKITVAASLQYTYLWLKVVNSLQLKMTTVYYVTHVRQVGLNIYHIYLKG